MLSFLLLPVPKTVMERFYSRFLRNIGLSIRVKADSVLLEARSGMHLGLQAVKGDNLRIGLTSAGAFCMDFFNSSFNSCFAGNFMKTP
jgi:hypothetical protein